VTGTPNLFVFDADTPPGRRDWAALLPVPPRDVYPEGGAFVPADGGPPARDGVVVAHASTLNGLVSDELDHLLASLPQHDLYLVVVSGGSAHSVADGERVYRRKATVAGGRTPDEGFRRSFADFWADFVASRRTEFALLEPADTHRLDRLEALCAGYVLAAVGGATGAAGELAPAVGVLGLDPVGRAPDDVRAKLGASREWFEAPASWRGVLGDMDRFGAELAAELRRRHGAAALPPGIGTLLEALKTADPVAPAAVAAAVRDMPHLRAG
jgi:hypothetical protein